MREIGQRNLLRLVGADPGKDRHVGNRIFAARDVTPGARQLGVEHAVQAIDFLRVALEGVGYFFRCIQQKMPVLAGHRPQAAHLPHQPLQGCVPAAQVGGQKAPGLLRQIDQDRAAFEHRYRRAAARRIVVDDGRHAIVRADREELRTELLAAPDVDGLERVGQAAFLQHDGYLPAVGRGPVVQVYHRVSLLVRAPCPDISAPASGTSAKL